MRSHPRGVSAFCTPTPWAVGLGALTIPEHHPGRILSTPFLPALQLADSRLSDPMLRDVSDPPFVAVDPHEPKPFLNRRHTC